MTVMMVTGNAARIPTGLADIFMPVRTMTATNCCRDGRGLPRGARTTCALCGRACAFPVHFPGQSDGCRGGLPADEACGAPSLMSVVDAGTYNVQTDCTTHCFHPDHGSGHFRHSSYLFHRRLQSFFRVLVRSIWEFLSAFPRDGMKAGGLLPAIVGTLLLTAGTAIVAVPLGVGAAIYLSELCQGHHDDPGHRIAIVNCRHPLGGLRAFRAGAVRDLPELRHLHLAGSLTSGDHDAAIIISTAEEALRAVPQSFRWSAPAWEGRAGRRFTGLSCRRHARHHHRRDPGIGARCRRDRADPLHRGGFLLAATAHLDPGSDDGPAHITFLSSAPRCPGCIEAFSTAPRSCCSSSCCR